MSLTDKILWTEGTFLRPQHFQQQDRFMAEQLRAKTDTLIPYAWGLKELTIDKSALDLGNIVIESCSGITPDGSVIDMPSQCSLPNPISPPKNTINEVISLCVPLVYSRTTVACYEENSNETHKYLASLEEVPDIHTKSQNKSEQLQTARLSTFLKLSSEEQVGFSSIPLCKIKEITDDGKLVLNPKFIPSCLNYCASNTMISLNNELLGLITQRANSLAKSLGTLTGSNVSDVANFMLLTLCNKYEPLLKHISLIPNTHPVNLYQVYLMLAGELSSICTASRRAIEYEPYNHTDIEKAFTFVSKDIREKLNWMPESKSTSITLKDHGYGVRTGTVHDTQLLKEADFILAIRATLESEKIRSLIPKQTTITTTESLRDFVTSHTPGIELTALPVAPHQLPYHEGYVYFKINRENKLWSEIVTSNTIAMHFAGDLPGMEIQLWAIKSIS